MTEKDIISIVADTLTERVRVLRVGRETFKIKPITLGKFMRLSAVFAENDLGDLFRSATPETLMAIISTNRRLLCYILAIYLSDSPQDESSLNRLADRLNSLLTNDQIISLFCVFSKQDHVAEIERHYHIDIDRRDAARVAKIKGDNSVQFGARSPWGQLLDKAAERYGWTLEYILWDVSYDNLRLMLSDAANSVYLTDKERQRCAISSDRSVINADDKDNIERLKQMFK